VCLYSACRISDYNGTETLIGWDKYINRFELSHLRSHPYEIRSGGIVTRAHKLFHLTPPLNHNFTKLRLPLKCNSLRRGTTLVKPSAS
jgi:hypothetical protein